MPDTRYLGYSTVDEKRADLETRFYDYPAELFGVAPNSSADQSTAIQAAIAEVAALGMQRAQAAGDVGSDSASFPRLVFRPGTLYRLEGPVALGLYTQLSGEGAFIKQFDDAQNIFESDVGGAGYRTTIRGLHLIGGKQQLVLSRANADVSLVRIVDCAFSQNDPDYFAVELGLRSGKVEIVRPIVDAAPRFLDITDTDLVTIRGGWINGYAFGTAGDGTTKKKPANSCSIRARGVAGTVNKLRISDVVFVPEWETGGVGDQVRTRWIDLYDYVALLVDGNTQFGSENGGFPIVYNFSSLAAVPGYPFVQYGGITIRDSQTSAGQAARADIGVVVLKTAVPQSIVIDNVTGVFGHVINGSQMETGATVDGDGYVVPGTGTPITVADWLTSVTDAQHPRMVCDVRAIGGAAYTIADAATKAALAPFMVVEDASAIRRTTLRAPIDVSPDFGEDGAVLDAAFNTLVLEPDEIANVFATDSFAGLLVVSDNASSGATAVLLASELQCQIIIQSASALFSATFANPNTINVYEDSGVVKIQNKLAITIAITVAPLRSRAFV